MTTRPQMIDLMPYWMQREDASGDWAKTLSIFQDAMNAAYAILERYKEAGNPDLVDLETVVDAMLVSFGCPFDFSRLTLSQKRLLVRGQVEIFRKIGTDDAVRDVVRIFTDRVVTNIIRGEVYYVWELGTHVLGDGISPLTFDVPTDLIVLSPSREFLIYSFMLDLDAVPTTAEQEEIRKLMMIVKPAYEHYMGIHGILPVVTINHAEIGMSDLDLTFDLH